jgi:uncharacterized protein YegJ (DUF2314 family)
MRVSGPVGLSCHTMTTLVALAIFALTCVAAGAKDRVIDVPTGDPEMETAIATARARLPYFWKALARPGPGEDHFSLKVPIVDGDKSEHFWLSGIVRRPDTITGTIDNDPASVLTVKLGQRYEFTEDQISDWMFVRNGKIVGNETIRPLLERMTREEATHWRGLMEKP